MFTNTETLFVQIIGRSFLRRPYTIQRETPIIKMISINGDTCSAFLVLIVLNTCGIIEIAVKTPAAIPVIIIRLFPEKILHATIKLSLIRQIN